MADVAGVLEKQGRQEEAEDGVKELLALRERFLGSEHVDTRATRKFLAALVGGPGGAIPNQFGLESGQRL